MTAAQNGHDSVVSALISAGASVDQAMKGTDSRRYWLLSATDKTNPDIGDQGNMSALDIANVEGHEDVVALLQDHLSVVAQ
eukprot:COSAG06_NODE_8010_length_2303_cov_2.623866_2_plen_81_part_00